MGLPSPTPGRITARPVGPLSLVETVRGRSLSRPQKQEGPEGTEDLQT